MSHCMGVHHSAIRSSPYLRSLREFLTLVMVFPMEVVCNRGIVGQWCPASRLVPMFQFGCSRITLDRNITGWRSLSRMFLTILMQQKCIKPPGPFLMLSFWMKRKFNLKRAPRYLEFSENCLPLLNFLRQNQFKNKVLVAFLFIS